MAEPFLSEIRVFSFNFAPRGWALCNGQLLPINQNQALFSLLGTTYGGDGRVNFALPNLQGRTPIHTGGGFTLGQVGGTAAHTLSQSELPTHSHTLNADAAGAALTPLGNRLGNAGSDVYVPPSLVSPLPEAVVDETEVALSWHEGVSRFYADSGTGGFAAAALVQMNAAAVSSVGGSQAHNNMQPFLTLNFCIALQGIFPSPT